MLTRLGQALKECRLHRRPRVERAHHAAPWWRGRLILRLTKGMAGLFRRQGQRCLQRRNRNSRGNKVYHKDKHVYSVEVGRQKEEDDRPRRRRSIAASTKGFSRSDTELNISAEAEYYGRRAEERGEAAKDWAIVDVPAGTERVAMDAVGGASQEITWQRYNGVRRATFNDSREDRSNRRYVAERSQFDDMWTEITKDLVIREAIEQLGYEFDETEYFFYIIAYLKYVSLALSPCIRLGPLSLPRWRLTHVAGGRARTGRALTGDPPRTPRSHPRDSVGARSDQRLWQR